MIDRIGNGGMQRLDTGRLQAARAGQPAGAAPPVAEADKAPASPATALAASGPPVDADRIAALRAAIADGSYRIDADAIADRMIALDLPAASG